MDGILFLAVVVLGIVAAAQGQRLRALAQRIDMLERTARAERSLERAAASQKETPPPAPIAGPAPRPARAPSAISISAPAPPAAPPPPPAPAPPAPPAPPVETAADRPGFENLIGARLPVWIGAVALVAAGFFLVRYSIEVGLLGPGVRTVLAALFAAILIAASEAVRRLPATRDDPRIAQALAGAGIATSYGTLYLAAAVYRFIAPLPAFAMMLAVTALGLMLALRHGPPTAVLALAGGFIAPLVAGYQAAGIAPLVIYLALFTGALFALAIVRNWPWLAIAATVAGFGWINFLLVVLGGGDLTAPATFALLLAITASLVLPRAGVTSGWIRLAPLVGGLVQLIAFAPALQFDGLAWAFYLTLAAATLVLAWRDATYLPGAVAATALALVLLALGWIDPPTPATRIATMVAALMLGGAGLAMLERARGWAWIALGGIAGPLLTANLLQPQRLADWQWALAELIAAALAAWISWRRRGEAGNRDPGLIGGALLAGILATSALGQIAGLDWIAVPLALVALALGAWSRRLDDAQLRALPIAALATILLAAARPVSAYLLLIFEAAAGDHLPWLHLPPLAVAARHILPGLAAAGLLLADPRQFGTARAYIRGIATLFALLFLYHLAKLPLAISDDNRFLAWGFVERAAITQALFAAGWLAFRRASLARLGIGLFVLAVVRTIWFDLLALNPAWVAQQVGGVPLLNAAVAHAALAALWCWSFGGASYWRRLGIGFTFVAVAALVRQAAHGTLLTGPIETGENYAYSAAFLLLALVWLALGIRGGARDLRLAGLALLTLVTFKVFLIDAAALDGLLRVVSFLGLGVALIGLSWVYTRFLAARPKASVATD